VVPNLQKVTKKLQKSYKKVGLATLFFTTLESAAEKVVKVVEKN
jgi:hypothetical protein